MAGWIKIHRGLKKHWLWKDDRKFKWWIDILFSVNYEAKNVIIGRKLYTCDRGQCVKSLETWAQEWRVSKQTGKAFFDTLEKDTMIATENIRVTTRITVCNYESYQGLINANDNGDEPQNDTQLKNTITINSNSKKKRGDTFSGDDSPAPQKQPRKTVEEKKADCDKRQVEFLESLRPFEEKYGKDMMNAFFAYWRERNKTETKMKWEMERTWETKLRLANWHKRDQKWRKPAPDNGQQDIDPKLQNILREEL